MMKQTFNELSDLLYSIRNKTYIADHLIKLARKDSSQESLLPTVLEELYSDAQQIIDDYCIKHRSLNR